MITIALFIGLLYLTFFVSVISFIVWLEWSPEFLIYHCSTFQIFSFHLLLMSDLHCRNNSGDFQLHTVCSDWNAETAAVHWQHIYLYCKIQVNYLLFHSPVLYQLAACCLSQLLQRCAKSSTNIIILELYCAFKLSFSLLQLPRSTSIKLS